MFKISVDTKLGDIPELEPWKKYLIYNPAAEQEEGALNAYNYTPAQIEEMSPTWDSEAMAKGLEKIAGISAERKPFYQVYAEADCMDDPQKRDVGFWFFPAENKTKDSFVLLLAGGALQSVCTAAEAFPVAAHLCEEGYPVFCLNYRVGGMHVLPKPLEDIAEIFRYLMANKEQFGIKSNRYIMGGFSAGAVLSAMWGTDRVGSVTYEIPKPEMLFPIYPAISHKYYYNESAELFMKIMYGDQFENPEYVNDFEIENQMNETYPPCYIVHCMDDDMIPVYNSIQLKKILDKNHVQAELEVGRFGGHGFGAGEKTDVRGWIDRMLLFFSKMV